MFFDGWPSVGRVIVTGTLVYLALVFFLRISGKRTLSKMNAFDLVVTVALGSTLSTVLLSRETPLADGVAALAVLIGLQFAAAWSAVRWPRFESIVKSSPTLLVYRGEIRHGDLRGQRVSEEEIRAAARNAGLPRLSDVGAMVLETDGTFSVIRADVLPAGDAMKTLDLPERRPGDSPPA